MEAKDLKKREKIIDIKRREKTSETLYNTPKISLANEESEAQEFLIKETVEKELAAPKFNIEKPKLFAIEKEKKPFPKYIKNIFTIAIILIIGASVFATLGIIEIKDRVSIASPLIYEKFKEAGRALYNLETDKASARFEDVKLDIESIKKTADSYGLSAIAN